MKRNLFKKKKKKQGSGQEPVIPSENTTSTQPKDWNEERKNAFSARLNNRRKNVDPNFDSELSPMDTPEDTLLESDANTSSHHQNTTNMNVEDVYQPPQVDGFDNFDNPAIGSGDVAYSNEDWYKMSGRIGRVQYMAYTSMWWFLIGIILYIIVFIVSLGVGNASGFSFASVGIIGSLLIVVIFLLSLYSSLALAYRRIQDMGKPAVWIVGMFLPIVSFVLGLLLIFKKGDEGTNQYGAPPAPYSKVELIMACMLPLLPVVLFAIPFAIIMGVAGQMNGVTDINDMDGPPAPIENVQIDTESINTEDDAIDSMSDMNSNNSEENDDNNAEALISSLDENTNTDVDVTDDSADTTHANSVDPSSSEKVNDESTDVVSESSSDESSGSVTVESPANIDTDDSGTAQVQIEESEAQVSITQNSTDGQLQLEDTQKNKPISTGDAAVDNSLDQINSAIGKDVSTKNSSKDEISFEDFMNEAELTISSE